MIIISVKNIKGLSMNRAGEGKDFRKSPPSHNWWPRGRSLADLSVHCRNTIRRSERRSNLERNTTKKEIGGRKAPERLVTVDRWHANDNVEVATLGFGKYLYGPEVTDSDQISRSLWSLNPFKIFKIF
jgi:hypothetical protein